MNTTSWSLIAVMLVVVFMLFPLTPPPRLGRPQAIPVNKTYPYRPTSSMGSNEVSFPGLDTKALCAMSDFCM